LLPSCFPLSFAGHLIFFHIYQLFYLCVTKKIRKKIFSNRINLLVRNMLSQHECITFYKTNTKARKEQKSTRVIIPRRWQAITKSRLLRRITYKFDFKLL
ncbi:hypothetical protein ANANG_G00218550, partial [Anguilla anguilla]